MKKKQEKKYKIVVQLPILEDLWHPLSGEYDYMLACEVGQYGKDHGHYPDFRVEPIEYEGESKQ